MHHLRRIALAVAVPVTAVAAVALGAGAATSSPTANAPLAAPSDGQNQQPSGGEPGTAPGGGSQNFQSFKTLRTFTFGTVSKPPVSTTKPTSKATTSASRSSVSPSASSKSSSARPSGSAGGGARGGVAGVPLQNCAGKTMTAPLTVKVGQAGGKQALVDTDGCALYLNTQDTPQQSVCTGDCLVMWPPAIGPGQAGEGVQQQNLGVFTRTDGGQQVTAFGHQLYYFQGDTAPGAANGQGNNQVWYLVDPSGNPITQ